MTRTQFILGPILLTLWVGVVALLLALT